MVLDMFVSNFLFKLADNYKQNSCSRNEKTLLLYTIQTNYTAYTAP